MNRLDAEERFRSVFMHMAEGVAIHEVVFDSTGNAVNYRIVDVNPQYEQFTGLRPEQVLGKLAHEAYGTSEAPYLREFSAVALSGRPARLETYFAPLARHYEISIAPMGYGHFATIFSDVTERKLHEQVLRESEWFLQQSQRVGHVGSYRYDITAGSWTGSPALDEVFGIDASFPKTVAGWLSLVVPEEREAMGHYLAEYVVAQGKTFDRRYRIIRQNDWQTRWVHGYGDLENDERGAPRYMIGTIQDITDVMRAERALQDKTDELDQFFNLTPDMLCIASSDARLLRLNAAWQRILGWSLDELQGRNDLEFVHPDDIAATNQARELLAAGTPVIDFVNRYRCRDGSYRWIEWRSTPVENGCVHAAARDVTDWVEHERAMRESEDRYRLLVELSPFMVAIHQAGKLVFINRAGLDMVGARSADEVLGRAVQDLVTDPRNAGGSIHANEATQTGQSFPVREQRLRRLNGQELDIEITGVSFPYQGVAATLLVAIDVTERKRGEQERRRLEEQLQQSQKLESVGRLAGGVAHDFNNLLTVIMSCADSLLSSNALAHDDRSDASDIAEAARRAADLTRQLLAFSRQQVLQPRVIVPSEVVASAGRMLRRLLGEDIELVIAGAHNAQKVFADPGQLEQILVNLAVNARDAMPSGGKLTIETSSVVLNEAFAAERLEVNPGEYVLLTVSDTGVGMDEATRARAFDPFFTTKSATGTGLGLATVYGIVRQSGGHIWLYSEPGAGSVFKIYLPRALRTSEVPASLRPVIPRRGDETILLVEDEERVRLALQRVLTNAGYTVFVAADGEEALALFEKGSQPIDLLLTDVVMPKMTGPQLAGRITALRPATRILYMSGYAPNSIVHHGVLDEGIEFIQKPLTPQALLAKVRAVLD